MSLKLDEAWATYSKSGSQNEKNFLYLQSNFSLQDESQIQHFECHDYGKTSLGQTCQKCKWEQAHVCSSISIRQYYILLVAEH